MFLYFVVLKFREKFQKLFLEESGTCLSYLECLGFTTFGVRGRILKHHKEIKAGPIAGDFMTIRSGRNYKTRVIEKKQEERPWN